MQANPRGRSTYTAQIKLAGSTPGAMDLKMTFGPLGGKLPAPLVFTADEAGRPLTQGHAEYDGRRIDVRTLVPWTPPALSRGRAGAASGCPCRPRPTPHLFQGEASDPPLRGRGAGGGQRGQ